MNDSSDNEVFFNNENNEQHNRISYDSFSDVSLIGGYNLRKIFVKNFWKYLIVIGSYYALPSLQFIFFQVHDANVHCYYNNKCKHDYNNIPAFNNVVSNIGYIVLGLLYIFYVRYTFVSYHNYGLKNIKALYYSLGVVLILEGIFSALYHICPSKLNFQFDTTFMFVGTSLMILTLYNKRHPDNLPSAFYIYNFLALVILLNILPLSGISDGAEVWFWLLIYVLVVYIMIVGTINVYYGKNWKFNKNIFKKVKDFKHFIQNMRPKDFPKFVVLIISNLMTLLMLIFGSIYKVDFTQWMLALFIGNLIIYFVFYIVNKLYYGERISFSMWILILVDITILSVSLIFYNIAVSDKMLTPQQSDTLNKPCVLFDYFDYHDLWHLFSSVGIFLLMVIFYKVDNDLINTENRYIKVF